MIIVGRAGRIATIIPREVTVLAHDEGWQPVAFTLDQNGTTFNFADGTSRIVKWMNADNTEATRNDIEAVLAEVTDFRIVCDRCEGTDHTCLDEITVTQPNSVMAGGT